MSFSAFFELAGNIAERRDYAEKKHMFGAAIPDNEPQRKDRSKSPTYVSKPQPWFNCKELNEQMDLIHRDMRLSHYTIRSFGPYNATRWWYQHSYEASMDAYRAAYYSKNCDDIITLQREIRDLTRKLNKKNDE